MNKNIRINVYKMLEFIFLAYSIIIIGVLLITGRLMLNILTVDSTISILCSWLVLSGILTVIALTYRSAIKK